MTLDELQIALDRLPELEEVCISDDIFTALFEPGKSDYAAMRRCAEFADAVHCDLFANARETCFIKKPADNIAKTRPYDLLPYRRKELFKREKGENVEDLMKRANEYLTSIGAPDGRVLKTDDGDCVVAWNKISCSA